MSEEQPNEKTRRRRRSLRFIGLVAVVVLATVFGLALLVNIFQRKQEARNPFFRVVELTDDTVDPSIWGKNFPLQYDDYLKTTDQVRTRYGGSEAEPRIESENSTGFHAPQEAARILGESINFSRKGQIALRGGNQSGSAQSK